MSKLYTDVQYREMRQEYTDRLENSDRALIKVLAIVTRLRRMAVDGSIHAKVSDVIEMCDQALDQPYRTPGEMPEES